MQPRHAARVVLLDSDNRVAIIHVQEYNYYKIPGGGVEPGEDLVTAAQREALEESGCNCEIIAELGKSETEFPEWKILDISTGFLAQVIADKQMPQFEAHEQARGFTVRWLESLPEAIKAIESNHVDESNAANMQARDLAYLKLAAEYLSSH